MLTDKQREWVLNGRKQYSEENTLVKRQRDQSVRDAAKKALSDLAFLAKELSPDQHKQVFKWKYLEPFAEGLHAYSTEEKKRFKSKRDAMVVNNELFYIGISMSNWFLSMSKNLVTADYYKLIWGTDLRALPSKEDIAGLTKVFYATGISKTKRITPDGRTIYYSKGEK